MFTVNGLNINNYSRPIEPNTSVNKINRDSKIANMFTGLSLKMNQPDNANNVKFSSNSDGDIFQRNFSIIPETEPEEEKGFFDWLYAGIESHHVPGAHNGISPYDIY